ncbi:MAG TPA: transcription elongation factor GreA [Cryomorphaceae bacterium]|nr:transcription elongation factor GreA [Owenweeksia sp.]MBF98499.1 transcription elongation factor GreA [Owenweeksia sp.]HAD96595.1 transcription elongation factor GreA [Cryomorphaceae bacterium]HBF19189.1 transcription elongation factor GreA [Cryomorphaceae bacterium]HCQ14844.1 transcription elongation factor GreA [Cryomorphaceae bacterium]|tara:strand:- start:813 stop:1289 length:477 start_codon:yes stop_codon:yes gene_type:complete
MANINYFTKEGLQKLKDELDHMKSVERPAISQQIAEARDKGDLSENAEYDAAKEAQGLLEMKISKLEDTLANARILDSSKMDTSKVMVLSTVTIKNVANKAKMKYKLVSESESDIKTGKISVNSPIGKGLMGKKVGDQVEIQVPAGKMTFEIEEIGMD